MTTARPVTRRERTAPRRGYALPSFSPSRFARSLASPGTSKSAGSNSGRISTSGSSPFCTPRPNGARLAHSTASASVFLAGREVCSQPVMEAST